MVVVLVHWRVLSGLRSPRLGNGPPGMQRRVRKRTGPENLRAWISAARRFPQIIGDRGISRSSGKNAVKKVWSRLRSDTRFEILSLHIAKLVAVHKDKETPTPILRTTYVLLQAFTSRRGEVE